MTKVWDVFLLHCLQLKRYLIYGFDDGLILGDDRKYIYFQWRKLQQFWLFAFFKCIRCSFPNYHIKLLQPISQFIFHLRSKVEFFGFIEALNSLRELQRISWTFSKAIWKNETNNFKSDLLCSNSISIWWAIVKIQKASPVWRSEFVSFYYRKMLYNFVIQAHWF